MNKTFTKTTLRAEGFSCPSCVDKIEKSIGRLKGVNSVKVHFSSARIVVEHDAQAVSADELVAAVSKVGYTSRVSPF